MTEEEEREWQERLRAAVAKTLRERAAKKAEREDHLRRRKYGKATLHANKLAHFRRAEQENAMETPDVTVKVSRELLAKMGDWSRPVQVMIQRLSTGEYTMIARTHTCEEQSDRVS